MVKRKLFNHDFRLFQQYIENAPVTLVLTLATLLESLSLGTSEFVSFDLSGLYRMELWRIFSSQIVFSSMAQTFIGLILLYICRQFERQLGSRKFGAFVFLSFLSSLLMQFSVVSLTHIMDISFIPAHGPFFLIFSLLPLFYAHIPRLQSSEFTILGVPFSEKSWTYLLGAQLSLSQGMRSVIPSLIGLLFGYFYLKNILYLQAFRLPRFIENSVSYIGKLIFLIVPFVSPTPRPNPRMTANATQRNTEQQLRQQQQQQQQAYISRQNRHQWDEYQNTPVEDEPYNPAMFQPSRPPTEDEINSVTALGFDRESAIQALRTADNNVEAAVNILLR